MVFELVNTDTNMDKERARLFSVFECTFFRLPSSFVVVVVVVRRQRCCRRPPSLCYSLAASSLGSLGLSQLAVVEVKIRRRGICWRMTPEMWDEIKGCTTYCQEQWTIPRRRGLAATRVDTHSWCMKSVFRCQLEKIQCGRRNHARDKEPQCCSYKSDFAVVFTKPSRRVVGELFESVFGAEFYLNVAAVRR